MMNIRSLMTDDHRHCDDLFAETERALAGRKDEAAPALARFRAAMLAHFAAEENTLFPDFEAQTGMQNGPTQVMRMEHEQMRALLDETLALLEEGRTEDCLGQFETMLVMMQQHNMKEENILYPMCDRHLAADLPQLLARLEAELAPA